MRLVAYLRVSTEGQVGEDKFGLDAQKESIKAFCKKEGHEVVGWYADEGVSGASDLENRPALIKLLQDKDIKNPPIEGVIVAKNDRLARDVMLYFAIKHEFARKKMELISVSENFEGYDRSSIIILESMLAAMAQVERINIYNRTSSGRMLKAKSGGYAGGRLPYGYNTVNHSYSINEEEAAVVRRVYSLKEQGLSIREIHNTLLNEGAKGKKGDEPISYSLVQNILNNRKVYEGYIKYSTGDYVKGKHTPIL